MAHLLFSHSVIDYKKSLNVPQRNVVGGSDWAVRPDLQKAIKGVCVGEHKVLAEELTFVCEAYDLVVSLKDTLLAVRYSVDEDFVPVFEPDGTVGAVHTVAPKVYPSILTVRV